MFYLGDIERESPPDSGWDRALEFYYYGIFVIENNKNFIMEDLLHRRTYEFCYYRTFIIDKWEIYKCVHLSRDCLCGLVVTFPGYRSRGPGSIPGATRFSEW
jgi:hypothetical protein